ncbi:MAG: hemerythrin family protein [Planctomycetaceae bacterium]|jgi:hemerythrin|nr:hemerythrin family protein [Planctomycetaceae bacterium]
MAYTWSKELETGNSVIDSQHQQLIMAINDLLNACSSGKGRDLLNKTLDFLSFYTAKHFADEEKLQLTYNYPDYANHKKLHEGFKIFVNELAVKMKVEGPTTDLVRKVSFGVGDWLINHIKKEDTKVAVHIKKNTLCKV